MLFNRFEAGFALLILINCISFIRAQVEDVIGTQEKQILDTILNDRYYDKNFRPGRSNLTGPTMVIVSLEIHRIKNLDDLKMELEISFTVIQEWIDERLRFSHLNANIPHIHSPYLTQQKVWVPDTYFTNQVTLDHQSSVGPNVHVRISADGTVLYKSRITGKFFCPLHLKEFPHDKQTCSLKFTSYGYAKDDIDFEWREPTAISISEEASYLPRFNLEGIVTPNCSSDSVQDEKGCIQLDFSFQRDFSSFLIQIYVPCTMMIIISFLSFWLDPVRFATPRAFICITILVLAVVQISALNANLPPVSFAKRIDIWTGVTLTFLFVALAEFVLVVCVCKIRTPGTTKNPTPPADVVSVDNLELPTVLKQYNRNNNPGPEIELQSDLVYNSYALNIDRVARFVFPLLFIVFLVIYWLIYVERLI